MPINIMLFIGVALACGIALFWFLQNFFSAQAILEKINNDLTYIAFRINENCDSNYIFFYYNPSTEEGRIDFNSNFVCAENRNVRKCVELLCGPSSPVGFDLSKINYIGIEKTNDIIIWSW
ncbi:MAG: hypothetical protein QXM75_01720 [Candidatus Diapherotrites archaeon]